jgi:hypothetical protein
VKPPPRTGKTPWNKGLTKETSKRVRVMAEGRTGDKNWMWRGGYSNEKDKRKGDWRKWREEVFKRDNYTCQMCGVVGGRLEPHHVKSWAKWPSLRFKVSNGMTLCHKCHKSTDSYGGRNNGANKK